MPKHPKGCKCDEDKINENYKKGFCLSDKIENVNGRKETVIYTDDVKEFIRLLKKDLCFCSAGERCTHHKFIDKLSGEKLI